MIIHVPVIVIHLMVYSVAIMTARTAFRDDLANYFL